MKKILLKGASILTVTTLGSYILGLLRDRIFATTFGASRTLDIYNAAFIIPDLLLNIFVAGALSAAFTPVFTSLWSAGQREDADKIATTILHTAVFTVLITGFIAFLLMPYFTNIIAPKFSAEEKKMLVSVSRLMLISPLIFAISNTFGNILISFERFLGYGLSPIFYNIGIISGAFIAKFFGIGIYGLVIGTLCGAFMHLLTRVIPLIKTGFKLKYPLLFKHHAFKKILFLMLPKMIGQPIEQLAFLIFTNIASQLAVGSIAIISFARNFQSVPVGVFGIAFSVAIFSALSRHAASRDKEKFLHDFWETTKGILGTTILSAIFLFFFGTFVIKIFLGGGKFTMENIITTGKVLSIFAFSIPLESMLHLVSRSFYAMKDTLTPTLFAGFGLVIIFFAAKFAVEKIGIIAIPLSFTIGSFVELVILSIILFARIRKWHRL